MKIKKHSGLRRLISWGLTLAVMLTTALAPSLTLGAEGYGIIPAAEALSLEDIPEALAQTLGLEGLPEDAEIDCADAEHLNSLTVKNGDGTSTAYIFQGPIKYLDKETDSIRFIDNKLKESDKSAGFLEKYAYENTANDIKVYLPKKIKKGVDMEYGDISVNMRPEIINNEKGMIREYAFAGESMEVMEYPNAFGEGYHLQYQAINQGIKENILVEAYNGTNTFSFELKLKKGSAELSGDGRRIFIKDETGETVFLLNQPYARDSHIGTDPDLTHRTFNDYYRLEQTGNKTYRVTMVIEEEFFLREGTVYPVLIDPTAYASSGSIEDMTAASSGSTAYGPDAEFSAVGSTSSTPWVDYITYAKNNFIWYFRYINPDKVTKAVHKGYVSSLNNVGNIAVCDSEGNLGISDNLSYSTVCSFVGTNISNTAVTGQGWYEFDITELCSKWMKSILCEPDGKNANYGYMLDFAGLGMIVLCSADHPTYPAHMEITYTEDLSLEPGQYYIKNKYTQQYLTAGESTGAVTMAPSDNSAGQLWYITLGQSGHYIVRALCSTGYLGLNGAAWAESGDQAVTKSYASEWRFVRNSDGSYRIVPLNTAIYALEQSYLQGNGTVCAEDYRGYANQQWVFEPVEYQVAVKLPNGTYIQRTKTSGSSVYKNESGVALEVNGSRQIIIEPIKTTNTGANGNDWHEAIPASFDYSITGSDKISVSRSGNTLTITGLALGEASVTITSGSAQTTVPIVVADKVLDVPHIRQEKSQWCWAACAQMLVKKYDPNDNRSQTDMAKIGQQKNEPSNDPANYEAIARIVEACTDNAVSVEQKSDQEFFESDLRVQLDAGNPVIYNSSRYASAEDRRGGHFRVIYGYYLIPGTNTYVYLVYDPWDPVAYENDAHYDIWRRSWENIKDEKAVDIEEIDIPETGYLTYITKEFVYFN